MGHYAATLERLLIQIKAPHRGKTSLDGHI
jgi:hypothetical protein